MIGKMKSNISLKDTLDYNIKEHSEIISINNVFGENWKEIEMQMLARQKLYEGRAQNLTAHIFLSPSIEDGKKLTLLDWKEIAHSFLEKAKITTHQSIAFLHQDKEHFHLHIVVNRIDENGNLYRHKNELALSQRLGDEIAKERNMIRASVVRKERQLAKRMGVNIFGTQGSIEKMRKDARDAAKTSFNSENVFTPQKYFESLETNGYKVKVYFGKTPDRISGYALAKKGEPLVKASTLGSEFTIQRLTDGFDQNSNDKSIKIGPVRNQIENILNESFTESIKGQKNFYSLKYFEIIRSKGCHVKEHFKDDTRTLRGYGIEKDGVFFNSSEIGSEFTLTSLKKRATELIGQHNQVVRESEFVMQSKYFPGSEGKLNKHIEENVSKELIRVIDLVKIETDLKELTSGHRYKSHSEFIRAIEEKGYHVHLRYNKGQLTGYAVHSGTEHYLDKEIENGKFGLDKLIEKGLFREANVKIKDHFEKSIQDTPILKTETQESLAEGNLATNVNNSLNDTHSHFIEQENKKKKVLEKELARKQIASELSQLAKQCILQNKSFDAMKFLNQLKKNGFDVIEHRAPVTDILRGYSVQKYGHTFQASEIGKNFTFSSLQKLERDLIKPQIKNEPRNLGLPRF